MKDSLKKIGSYFGTYALDLRNTDTRSAGALRESSTSANRMGKQPFPYRLTKSWIVCCPPPLQLTHKSVIKSSFLSVLHYFYFKIFYLFCNCVNGFRISLFYVFAKGHRRSKFESVMLSLSISVLRNAMFTASRCYRYEIYAPTKYKLKIAFCILKCYAYFCIAIKSNHIKSLDYTPTISLTTILLFRDYLISHNDLFSTSRINLESYLDGRCFYYKTGLIDTIIFY